MSVQSKEYRFQTAPIANANIIAMYNSRSSSSSGVIKPSFITVMSATYKSQEIASEQERSWLWICLLYFKSNGWLSCCSLENPIKFNRIVPVWFAVYMTFAIDSIKLITLLLRREWTRPEEGETKKREEKKHCVDWPRCVNMRNKLWKYFLSFNFISKRKCGVEKFLAFAHYCWLLLSLCCCLLFKWNLFAYSSKQFQDENVHA